ncbi:hypothetical protein CTAYLR_005645 [Chrysophaeum taylorii]|uniref:Aldehyde dehydrogenase domain-containing protein n=1 Tax=Chrysophaeum taylorii TaxID=2483200 RepID=A0AAD7UKV9_9STRA|nr:hypothetical protein CTAYLR_005645 [Chrysophaeum taylorii]
MVQGVEIKANKIQDLSPQTGELIAEVACATVEEVESTVARARAAQPAWAARPLEERVAMLKAAVKVFKDETQELAALMTREMGKLIHESFEEVEGIADKDKFLELVEDANGEVVVANAIVYREPHGTVGIVAPWNFPMDEILLLALPALAAGNAVVVKPSEVAPLCGGAVVDGLNKTLPRGLLGIVQGDGAVGQILVDRVDMVGMTGSSATGKKILERASKSLKPCVLECGGKDPMLVLESANLETAAKDAVSFSVLNCGQVCCAIERIYVPETKAKEFEKLVVDEAKAYDPLDGTLAPLVSKVQRDVVAAHVTYALDAGARLLLGGPQVAADVEAKTPPGSSFYPVTVLADVPHDANRDETFGPTVAITPYADLGDALKMANDSKYGLTACVYGAEPKALDVAKKLKAGQVGVNTWPLAQAPLECPWIGHLESGFGYHSGPDGWRQFSVPKSIVKPAAS